MTDAADASQHCGVGRAQDQRQQTVHVSRLVDHAQTSLRDASVARFLPLHDVIVGLVCVVVERVSVSGVVQGRYEGIQHCQVSL